MIIVCCITLNILLVSGNVITFFSLQTLIFYKIQFHTCTARDLKKAQNFLNKSNFKEHFLFFCFFKLNVSCTIFIYEDSSIINTCFLCIFQKDPLSVTKSTSPHLHKPGETANLKCSHSIPSYNRILWYRQSQNRQLQFLGHMIGDTGYSETGLDVKIEGSANKDQTATLTILGLSLNSSAVYFCAARLHSAA